MGRLRHLVGPVTAVVLVATMVTGRTSALLYDEQTSSPQLRTAVVTLTSDQDGSTVVGPGDLTPGATTEACTRVVYDGTADTTRAGAVTVEISDVTVDIPDLVNWLTITVETDGDATLPGDGSCGDFTADSTALTVTPAQTTTPTDTTFHPAPGDTAAFRVAVTLDLNAPDTVQSASGTIDVTWRSTTTTGIQGQA